MSDDQTAARGSLASSGKRTAHVSSSRCIGYYAGSRYILYTRFTPYIACMPRLGSRVSGKDPIPESQPSSSDKCLEGSLVKIDSGLAAYIVSPGPPISTPTTNLLILPFILTLSYYSFIHTSLSYL